MRRALVSTLLRLYPASWRREYGEELRDLLLAQALEPSRVLNVIYSALGERIHRMTTRPHSLWWIVGGIVSACALSLISAAYLWRAFIAPLTQAPHTRLVLTGPRGTVGVMWIKLPLLAAFLLGYLWLLFVARKSLRLSSFPIAAGSLFVLCAIAGYVVWDHGAASRLQGSTPIILLHCFNVFAGIIAGAAALPQVLLAMIFRRKLQNIS